LGKAMGLIPHVHVADRESDDYKYLVLLNAAGEQFVSRVSSNRVLKDGSELFTAMESFKIQLCRNVHIGLEKDKLATPHKLAVGQRKARDAKLKISAGTIEIQRPKRTPKSFDASATLNYVLVQEIEVAAGHTPVVWRLVTNLPIDTPEQITRIIDIYRARWIIEEFFKALKTGCAFSELQLESFERLSKMLALMLPVAWKFLEIRMVARICPDAPATIVFTKRQIVILRALHDHAHAKKRLAEKPTIKQAMYAIASLVGHFPSNGDPGWLILSRGMRRLWDAESDYLALRPHLSKLH